MVNALDNKRTTSQFSQFGEPLGWKKKFMKALSPEVGSFFDSSLDFLVSLPSCSSSLKCSSSFLASLESPFFGSSSFFSESFFLKNFSKPFGIYGPCSQGI